MVDASVSLIPERDTFIYFLVFYLIGWVLFKSKQHLQTFMLYDWICTISAIVLAAIQGLVIQIYGLEPNSNSVLLILFSSVIVCLLFCLVLLDSSLDMEVTILLKCVTSQILLIGFI